MLATHGYAAIYRQVFTPTDRAFIDTVLGLHDTFVTAQDLLSNLTVAYHLARRENDTVTQQKVVDVVKSWTSTSRIDFRTNPLVSLTIQQALILPVLGRLSSLRDRARGKPRAFRGKVGSVYQCCT